MNEEQKYEPLCKNEIIALDVFLEELKKIINIFPKIRIEKEEIRSNNLKYSWIQFHIQITEKYIDLPEIRSLIDLNHDIFIDFEDENISITKRYYIETIEDN